MSQNWPFRFENSLNLLSADWLIRKFLFEFRKHDCADVKKITKSYFNRQDMKNS